jgi:uncharacterized protein
MAHPMRTLRLALLTVLGVACQRAAQEDFARPTVATSMPAAPSVVQPSPEEAPTQKVDVAPSGRCLKLTPSEPPPPVASGPAARCPPDPEPGLPKLPVVHVDFPDSSNARVDAELVRSEHDSERGLMYRHAMPESHGMLFDLQVRADHKFWMHNTCIPLDLLYVDEDGVIVGIVENAPTLDDTSRGVGCLSRWVLEVNAGWSRRHAVKAGQHMTLP